MSQTRQDRVLKTLLELEGIHQRESVERLEGGSGETPESPLSRIPKMRSKNDEILSGLDRAWKREASQSIVAQGPRVMPEDKQPGLPARAWDWAKGAGGDALDWVKGLPGGALELGEDALGAVGDFFTGLWKGGEIPEEYLHEDGSFNVQKARKELAKIDPIRSTAKTPLDPVFDHVKWVWDQINPGTAVTGFMDTMAEYVWGGRSVTNDLAEIASKKTGSKVYTQICGFLSAFLPLADAAYSLGIIDEEEYRKIPHKGEIVKSLVSLSPVRGVSELISGFMYNMIGKSPALQEAGKAAVKASPVGIAAEALGFEPQGVPPTGESVMKGTEGPGYGSMTKKKAAAEALAASIGLPEPDYSRTLEERSPLQQWMSEPLEGLKTAEQFIIWPFAALHDFVADPLGFAADRPLDLLFLAHMGLLSTPVKALKGPAKNAAMSLRNAYAKGSIEIPIYIQVLRQAFGQKAKVKWDALKDKLARENPSGVIPLNKRAEWIKPPDIPESRYRPADIGAKLKEPSARERATADWFTEEVTARDVPEGVHQRPFIGRRPSFEPGEMQRVDLPDGTAFRVRAPSQEAAKLIVMDYVAEHNLYQRTGKPVKYPPEVEMVERPPGIPEEAPMPEPKGLGRKSLTELREEGVKVPKYKLTSKPWNNVMPGTIIYRGKEGYMVTDVYRRKVPTREGTQAGEWMYEVERYTDKPGASGEQMLFDSYDMNDLFTVKPAAEAKSIKRSGVDTGERAPSAYREFEEGASWDKSISEAREYSTWEALGEGNMPRGMDFYSLKDQRIMDATQMMDEGIIPKESRQRSAATQMKEGEIAPDAKTRWEFEAEAPEGYELIINEPGQVMKIDPKTGNRYFSSDITLKKIADRESVERYIERQQNTVDSILQANKARYERGDPLKYSKGEEKIAPDVARASMERWKQIQDLNRRIEAREKGEGLPEEIKLYDDPLAEGTFEPTKADLQALYEAYPEFFTDMNFGLPLKSILESYNRLKDQVAGLDLKRFMHMPSTRRQWERLRMEDLGEFRPPTRFQHPRDFARELTAETFAKDRKMIKEFHENGLDMSPTIHAKVFLDNLTTGTGKKMKWDFADWPEGFLPNPKFNLQSVLWSQPHYWAGLADYVPSLKQVRRQGRGPIQKLMTDVNYLTVQRAGWFSSRQSFIAQAVREHGVGKAGSLIDRVADLMIQELQHGDWKKSPEELLQNPQIAAYMEQFPRVGHRSLLYAMKGRQILDAMIMEQNMFRDAMGDKLIPYRTKDGKGYTPEQIRDMTWQDVVTGDKGLSHDKIVKLLEKENAPLPEFIVEQLTAPGNPRAKHRTGRIPTESRETSLTKKLYDYADIASRDIFNRMAVKALKDAANKIDNTYKKASAKSKGTKPKDEAGHVGAHALRAYSAEAFVGTLAGLDRAISLSVGMRKAMKGYRNMLQRTAFPFNVGWNLFTQTSSIALTMARHPVTTPIAMITYLFSPKLRGKLRANTYALQMKNLKRGRITKQETASMGEFFKKKTKLETVEDVGTFGMRVMEDYLAGASALAEYMSLKLKRMPEGEDFWAMVSDTAAKTQSMYNWEDRPGMLRSEIGRTVAPFQSFSFEVMNTVKEFAGKTGQSPGNVATRLKRILVGAAAVQTVNMFTQLMTGKKKWNASSFVPYYDMTFGMAMAFMKGDKWEMRKGLASPLATGQELAQAIHGILTGKAGAFEDFVSWSVKYGMGFAKIPGGLQLEKMRRGLLEYMHEYE